LLKSFFNQPQPVLGTYFKTSNIPIISGFGGGDRFLAKFRQLFPHQIPKRLGILTSGLSDSIVRQACERKKKPTKNPAWPTLTKFLNPATK